MHPGHSLNKLYSQRKSRASDPLCLCLSNASMSSLCGTGDPAQSLLQARQGQYQLSHTLRHLFMKILKPPVTFKDKTDKA